MVAANLACAVKSCARSFILPAVSVTFSATVSRQYGRLFLGNISGRTCLFPQPGFRVRQVISRSLSVRAGRRRSEEAYKAGSHQRRSNRRMTYQPPSNACSDRQSRGGIGGGSGFDVLDQQFDRGLGIGFGFIQKRILGVDSFLLQSFCELGSGAGDRSVERSLASLVREASTSRSSWLRLGSIMTSAHLRTEKPDTSRLIIYLMGVLGRSAIRPRTLSCLIGQGCQRALRAPSLRCTEWLHYRSARYLACRRCGHHLAHCH